MTAHQLILAAAAGAISLAICAVLWALAQRRNAQERVDELTRRLAGVEARAETAQASAEAFDSALLAVEDGRAFLASGEDSLAVCAAALGVSDADPQALVNALMRADPDHARQNAAAAEIVLTAADLAHLDAAFPPPRRKSGLEMI